jgi:hypothetical protein
MGTCADLGVCSPAATPPDGFRVCIAREGDADCPIVSPYSEKHVFYKGIDDTRDCTACTCGAPAGGSCSALVTIYTDAACSAQTGSAMATNAATSPCVDVPAGSAIGSKAMGPITYMPGACAAIGGEPVGDAVPRDPVTVCCLQ